MTTPLVFLNLFPSYPISLSGLQSGLGSALSWLSGSWVCGRLQLFWWSLSASQEVLKEDRVEVHEDRNFLSASSLKQGGNLSMRSRGGGGRAPGEAQPPGGDQKREFCGCPMAVTGWDARKGWELTPCMLLLTFPSMVSTELVSNFFLVARAQAHV